MRRKPVSLFEWLADHRTDLEITGQDDARLFILIDDYIRLLDTYESADKEGKGRDARLLKDKKRKIMKLISRKKRVRWP